MYTASIFIAVHLYYKSTSISCWKDKIVYKSLGIYICYRYLRETP